MTPEEVRRIRKRLGLSQSQFAALLGVHKITVAKWEAGMQGLRGPTERLVRLVAQQEAKPVTKTRPKSRRRRKA